MQEIANLTMEAFLPLARMKATAASAHATYINAKPFPRRRPDNLFPPGNRRECAVARIPYTRSDTVAEDFDSAEEIKLASAAEASFGRRRGYLMYHLNPITFLEFSESYWYFG